jgi:glutamine synthetase
MAKKKDLEKRLRDAGVKTCIASYVDMHGALKSKFVPIDHFDQMMAGSEMFTGAALDGVPQEINDEEVACMPDPEAAMILPWEPTVALIPSDLWCGGRAVRGVLAQHPQPAGRQAPPRWASR